MGKTMTLPGSWTMARVEQVLANAAARAMLRGKPQPVTERVLARLAAAR